MIEDLLAPGEDALRRRCSTSCRAAAQFNLRASYHEDVALAEVVAADPEIADLRARTRDLPEDAAYGDRVRLGELVARAMEDKRAFDADVLLEARRCRYVAAHSPASRRVGSTMSLDVAFLVDDELRERVRGPLWRAWRRRCTSGSACSSSGPMAPYDFVGDA